MPPKKRRKKQEYSAEEWKVKRGRRYRQKKAKEEKNVEKEGTGERRGAGYVDVIKENALFEKYYQGQGFIPTEDWPKFLATLRESLPATFRITGTWSIANHVLFILKKRFFRELAELEIEGEKIPPPTPLPWYPKEMAWSVPLSRKFIRKSPLVSKFHAFLVRENEQGNISRQEAVSMIPPLVLDVKPTHKVLDMCAAPGSKTAQLIEFLHAEDTESRPMPSGVVVANDANNKRCYMLVHQAKRLNSPCFMVTNHDASVYPMLYYHDEDDVRHPVCYDRVLCDVPCSGDGTLRKNPVIWQSWTPLMGPSLHKLQLRILNRGLELLVRGGRLVYSTCSLNPVEDEAVVATALSLCKGAVELVDCRQSLSGLITLPGLTSWKVMSNEGDWLDSYEDIPKSLSKHFSVSMFPPQNPDTLHLQKCMRVLPHSQDSGGFFVAVLEKKDWLPWQSKMKAYAVKVASNLPHSVDHLPETEHSAGDSDLLGGDSGSSPANIKAIDGTLERNDCDVTQEAMAIDEGNSNPSTDEVKKESSNLGSSSIVPERERPTAAVLGRPDFQVRGRSGFKEDPYVFFDKDSEFFETIKSFYGLPEKFPSEQLLTRTRTGKKRNIYFSSKPVKELTIRNERIIKIINIGVKVMSRCEHNLSPCSFRLCQEGVDLLIPYIGKRRVMVEHKDLAILLKEANPLIISLSQCAQDDLQTLGIGPVVFLYTPNKRTITQDETEPREESSEIWISCPLFLSGWLAAKSVRLYLDRNYRYHFLSMLGHDPPTNQCLDTIGPKTRSNNSEENGEEDGGVASEAVEEGEHGTEGKEEVGVVNSGDERMEEQEERSSSPEVNGERGVCDGEGMKMDVAKGSDEGVISCGEGMESGGSQGEEVRSASESREGEKGDATVEEKDKCT